MNFESTAQSHENLQWLLGQLWQKKTARAPQFSFNVAETITMHKGQPLAWFFSIPTGEIVKKSQNLLKLDKIARDLKSRTPAVHGTPALTTFTVRPQKDKKSGECRIALCIGHLQAQNIEQYLSAGFQSDGYPSLLQPFIGGGDQKDQNTVCVVRYETGSVLLHKLVNRYTLSDTNVSLKNRTVTFEVHRSKQSEVVQRVKIAADSALSVKLRRAVREIVRHVASTSGISVTVATFYFKEGPQNGADDAKISLLFAKNIKTEKQSEAMKSDHDAPLIEFGEKLVLCPQVHAAEQEEQELLSKASNRKMGQKSSDPGKTQEDKEFVSSYNSLKRDDLSIEPKLSPAQAKERLNQLLQYYFGKLVQGKCANCKNTRGPPGQLHDINAAIIIRLQDYFERQPFGMLMLPATSVQQQQFFEAVYEQIQKRQTLVPVVLREVFGIDNDADYALLRHDQRFLYQSWQMCDMCYANVTKMMIQQSNEQKMPVIADSSGFSFVDPKVITPKNRLDPIFHPPVFSNGQASTMVSDLAGRSGVYNTLDFRKQHSANIMLRMREGLPKINDTEMQQQELIKYKIDEIKQRDAQLMHSLNQINQFNVPVQIEKEKRKERGLRLRTATNRVKAIQIIDRNNRNSRQKFFSDKLMTVTPVKNSNTLTQNNQSKKNAKVFGEAAEFKRMRLSQKLEVKKQFDGWKQLRYKMPQNDCSPEPLGISPTLQQRNTIQQNVVTSPKNGNTFMILNDIKHQANLAKKARATSAAPAQIRNRKSFKRFAKPQVQPNPEDYMLRNGMYLFRNTTKNSASRFFNERSPSSLYDANRIYSHVQTLNARPSQGLIGSEKWPIYWDSIQQQRSPLRGRSSSSKRKMRPPGSAMTMRNNRHTHQVPTTEYQMSHPTRHSQSPIGGLLKSDQQADDVQYAVRSSETIRQYRQLEIQRELANRVLRLNEDTANALKDVELNAQVIHAQLQGVRGESQEILDASSQAVSLIVAARQGMASLKRSAEQSDQEWINLSQGLHSLPTSKRTSDAVLSPANDSREKLHPEQPIRSRQPSEETEAIVRQPDSSLSLRHSNPDNRSLAAGQTVQNLNQISRQAIHEYAATSDGPTSHNTGSQRNTVTLQAMTQGLDSVQSNGVLIVQRSGLPPSRQRISQPVFCEGLHQQRHQTYDAMSNEHNSIRLTDDNNECPKALHSDLSNKENSIQTRGHQVYGIVVANSGDLHTITHGDLSGSLNKTIKAALQRAWTDRNLVETVNPTVIVQSETTVQMGEVNLNLNSNTQTGMTTIGNESCEKVASSALQQDPTISQLEMEEQRTFIIRSAVEIPINEMQTALDLVNEDTETNYRVKLLSEPLFDNINAPSESMLEEAEFLKSKTMTVDGQSHIIQDKSLASNEFPRMTLKGKDGIPLICSQKGLDSDTLNRQRQKSQIITAFGSFREIATDREGLGSQETTTQFSLPQNIIRKQSTHRNLTEKSDIIVKIVDQAVSIQEHGEKQYITGYKPQNQLSHMEYLGIQYEVEDLLDEIYNKAVQTQADYLHGALVGQVEEFLDDIYTIAIENDGNVEEFLTVDEILRIGQRPFSAFTPTLQRFQSIDTTYMYGSNYIYGEASSKPERIKVTAHTSDVTGQTKLVKIKAEVAEVSSQGEAEYAHGQIPHSPANILTTQQTQHYPHMNSQFTLNRRSDYYQSMSDGQHTPSLFGSGEHINVEGGAFRLMVDQGSGLDSNHKLLDYQDSLHFIEMNVPEKSMDNSSLEDTQTNFLAFSQNGASGTNSGTLVSEIGTSREYGTFVEDGMDPNYNHILSKLEDNILSTREGSGAKTHHSVNYYTLEKGEEMIEMLKKLAQEGRKLDYLETIDK